MTNEYEPDAGDLVWTDFDPRTGREQGGRRPAVVLSPAAFWRATGFVFLAPITSRVRPFPSSIVMPEGRQIAGEVLLDQTRSIDAPVRPLRFTGERLPLELLEEARAKLGALLGIA